MNGHLRQHRSKASQATKDFTEVEAQSCLKEMTVTPSGSKDEGGPGPLQYTSRRTLVDIQLVHIQGSQAQRRDKESSKYNESDSQAQSCSLLRH